MPLAENQLIELKHAYQVLGVPLSASALSIKQAYRKLVKRWHPDLYQSGTPDHAEAARMSSFINSAYSIVQSAPLRYYTETNLFPDGKGRRDTQSSTNESTSTPTETLPKTDRIEFWVRFVCGALFGILVSFRLVLEFFDQPAILVVGVAAGILGFGFAAARYGDRFWYSILGRWWFWS
jgi:curved DNA-binding protein CbpA